MWEVFLAMGIIFIFLGIRELKKVKHKHNNTNASPQTKDKKILPIKIAEENENSVKGLSQREIGEDKTTPTFTSANQSNNSSVSLENHWIIQKVKERFEKKKEKKDAEFNPFDVLD